MRPVWPPPIQKDGESHVDQVEIHRCRARDPRARGCLVATSGNAQAHPRFGVGLGIGIATGAVIGAAVASGAYASPVYSCRYVERYDRWGNIRLIKVCDAY